jgi:hypothetical protein
MVASVLFVVRFMVVVPGYELVVAGDVAEPGVMG